MLTGIVYASIFYTALYYPGGVPRRQLMIMGLVGLLLITGLLAVVYGVQYAEVAFLSDRFGARGCEAAWQISRCSGRA